MTAEQLFWIPSLTTRRVAAARLHAVLPLGDTCRFDIGKVVSVEGNAA
jgi:hypothetical protein